MILSIEDNSAFIGTDVREYDLIVELDGVKTPTTDKLKELLGKKQVGDTAELVIARYEKGVARTYEVTVTLIDMNAE